MAVNTKMDLINFQPIIMCFGSLKIASKIDHFGCILHLLVHRVLNFNKSCFFLKLLGSFNKTVLLKQHKQGFNCFLEMSKNP